VWVRAIRRTLVASPLFMDVMLARRIFDGVAMRRQRSRDRKRSYILSNEKRQSEYDVDRSNASMMVGRTLEASAHLGISAPHRQSSLRRESADRRLHGPHTRGQGRGRLVKGIRPGGEEGPRTPAEGAANKAGGDGERRRGSQSPGDRQPRRHRTPQALRRLIIFDLPSIEPNHTFSPYGRSLGGCITFFFCTIRRLSRCFLIWIRIPFASHSARRCTFFIYSSNDTSAIATTTTTITTITTTTTTTTTITTTSTNCQTYGGSLFILFYRHHYFR
jgi:hypothetical protein